MERDIMLMQREDCTGISLSPLEVRNITWEKMEASRKGS